MTLLEQVNDKDDTLLKKTGSSVKRQKKPQTRTKQAPTPPQNKKANPIIKPFGICFTSV